MQSGWVNRPKLSIPTQTAERPHIAHRRLRISERVIAFSLPDRAIERVHASWGSPSFR